MSESAGEEPIEEEYADDENEETGKIKPRTLVYDFGCSKPMNLHEYVDRQSVVYGRYYNKQIELERQVYFQREELRCKLSTEYRKLTEERKAKQLQINEAYVELKKKNKNAKAKVAEEKDTQTITSLNKEDEALREQLNKVRNTLKEDEVYVRLETVIFEQKEIRWRLNNNLFGDFAATFLKFHLGQKLTDKDCLELAHVFELIKQPGKAKEKVRGKVVKKKAVPKSMEPTPWFVELEKAFLAMAEGKRPTADGREALDELRKHMGRVERPDSKPHPNDYGFLWWGTRAKVKEAVSMAVASRAKIGKPAKFGTSDGDMLIATQLQNSKLTEEGIFKSESLWLQADLLKTLKKEGKVRVAKFRVRVGSLAGGRKPMFVEVKAKLSRRLPQDAVVIWATLVRRSLPVSHLSPRRGSEDGRYFYPSEKWRLQLTIKTKEPKKVAEKGEVGVDYGWKVLDDGSIRVATWCGRDPAKPMNVHARSADAIQIVRVENGLEYGELRLLPTEVKKRIRKGQEVDVTVPSPMDRVDKNEDLQSIMDRAFDAVTAKLIELRKTNAKLPAWFMEMTEKLGLWRSQDRLLAVLARGYREYGGPDNLLAGWEAATGEREVMTELLDWSVRYRHLKQYETGNRRKMARVRLALYRDFAVMLRSRFAAVHYRDVKLTSRNKKKKVESNEPERGERLHNRTVSLGLLRGEVAKMHANPCKHKIEADDLHVCPGCRSAVKVDREQFHTCECGATWDRSHVAAKTILLASDVAPK